MLTHARTPRRRPLPTARPALVQPVLALVVALGPAACSSAPQPTPQVRIEPRPPAAKVEPPADNLLASVTIARRPEKLVVDGDLAEWGALPAPAPRDGASTSASPRPEPLRRAEEPSSRVALAVSSDGLAIAGEMSPSHAKGFWVTVVFDMPDVPPIGYWQRGGGVSPLYCYEGMDPDALAECKTLQEKHETFESEHLAFFEGVYFISPAGVSLTRFGKVVLPVDGAQVAFKPTDTGFRVEATLPAKSLPRTQQAPLESLRAFARGGEPGKPPQVPIEEWSDLVLPEPVGFEPYADLRAAVFAAAMRRPLYKPFSMSYQPGEGLEVSDLVYATSTDLHESPQILYSKQAVLGDLEVGYAYTGTSPMGVGWTSVVSLHKGAPVAVMDLTGSPRGVVQRDGELHAFAYSSWENEDGLTSWAGWEAVAFGPDGAPVPDILEEAHLPPLVGPIESHAPDFSTFSILATVWDHETGSPGARMELEWKWDAKAHRYALKAKELSPAASKKPPKGQRGAKAPRK